MGTEPVSTPTTPSTATAEAEASSASRPVTRSSAFGPRQLAAGLPGALRKLDPRLMWRNPVMFIVEVGAALTTVTAFVEPSVFTAAIAVWLWLTVVFANLAEAVAEGRGKAQADTLRKTRSTTSARRVLRWDAADAAALTNETEDIASVDLAKGDVVVVVAGEVIPGDGDVVEGIASVDESAVTGESAPVIRESGGDRSAVTGGTRVLSDRIVVRITSTPGETFIDRMIRLVEGAARQKTPNEIALNILLASLSIVFVIVCLTMQPIAGLVGATVSVPVLIALLVCLIPTTIGALLSAIGIAGMDRLVQHNVLAMSGRAVEAAGDITTLLLDKTGTITYGNRRASRFVPVPGVTEADLTAAAALSSAADGTPEGRSIVDLALAAGAATGLPAGAVEVPFTAQTRMSGLDLADGSQIRKGAAAAVLAWAGPADAAVVASIDATVAEVSDQGGTPLVVGRRSPDGSVALLGVVHLKDVVKEGMAARFANSGAWASAR